MSGEVRAQQVLEQAAEFTLPDAYRERPTLETLRRSFEEDQYVLLPGFIGGELFELLREEVARLEDFSQPRNFTMPGYDTPRLMNTLGGQLIRRESRLLAHLYEQEELRDFVGRVVGKPVYDCHDPNEWMVATILQATGSTHGWHLDDPPVALVCFIESPAEGQGGLVEFVKDWRKLCEEIGADPDTQVDRTLRRHPGAGLVKAVHNRAGDAYLLRADLCLHRVTPLTVPGAKRVILNMAFEWSPDVWRKGLTAQILFDGSAENE